MGKMALSTILEARRAQKDFHRFGLSTFACAVVGDRHLWLNRVCKCLRIRAGLPMTRSNKQIDGSNAVDRTIELEFLVPGEITEIQHAEFAERDVAAHRLFVLGVADGLA